VSVHFVDELDGGFGWIEDRAMRRASHALTADGEVWVIDPIEAAGVDERIRSLGEPAGVIQLLDRHARDAEAYAGRLGVPLHVVPSAVAGSPFVFLPVLRRRLWSEVALWWPARRILVCADALGTVPYFCAGDEPAGVHPFLRLLPPRALRGLGPEHLLVGHGEGLHGEDVGLLVDDAIRKARRRIPRWLVGVPRLVRSAS
jgi:hypothetical protein